MNLTTHGRQQAALYILYFILSLISIHSISISLTNDTYNSNLTHVVCHCTHLTSFGVHFKNSLKPLEEAGYNNLKMLLTNFTNFFYRDKIANPSFSNLIKRPAPIILVACVLGVYLFGLVAAIKYDRHRGVSIINDHEIIII